MALYFIVSFYDYVILSALLELIYRIYDLYYMCMSLPEVTQKVVTSMPGPFVITVSGVYWDTSQSIVHGLCKIAYWPHVFQT